MSGLVTLKGGPFGGVEMPAPAGRWTPIVCEGTNVPEGMVARYKPTRDTGVWRFDGYDKVIAKLPLPSGASA